MCVCVYKLQFIVFLQISSQQIPKTPGLPRRRGGNNTEGRPELL